jgi:hypothetical protein
MVSEVEMNQSKPLPSDVVYKVKACLPAASLFEESSQGIEVLENHTYFSS